MQYIGVTGPGHSIVEAGLSGVAGSVWAALASAEVSCWSACIEELMPSRTWGAGVQPGISRCGLIH